jgi:hypothetical protein
MQRAKELKSPLVKGLKEAIGTVCTNIHFTPNVTDY